MRKKEVFGMRRKWNEKQKVLLILGICMAVVGILVIVLIPIVKRGKGSRPFENLTGEEIASVTLEIVPPGKRIPVENLTEFVELLQKVVVYEKDSSWEDYAGQSVKFEILMRNGTEKIVVAYNPFVVIDGVGYQTKEKPCEELGAYANSLLNEEG